MPVSEKLIRHPDFAARLDKAVERHPQAAGWGRQRWLRDRVEEKSGNSYSNESVRKWFAGETRPRPEIITIIAEILGVDEAWLSVGSTPEASPTERRRLNAVADGAVNLVAGLIQLNGGHIAFPTGTGDKQPDLYAIIGGQQFSIQVRRAQQGDAGSIRLMVQPPLEHAILLLVVDGDHVGGFSVVQLPAAVIEKYGENRGGYIELVAQQSKGAVKVDTVVLPMVRQFSFSELTQSIG